MPAIRKNSNIVTFKNAETGIRETLYLTPKSHRKFKDVGKRRRTIIPMLILPPKPHILSKEGLKALVEKHEKHTARQALLYQVLQAKELLDKIPNPLLPLLLKLQIGPRISSLSLPITIKPPFHQTRDFEEILKPTLDYILLFFNEMRKTKVWRKEQQYCPVWKWFRKLEDKISEVEKEDHMITAKEWRLLKGACKRLRSVDLSKPKTRVPEICQIVLELNIYIP